MDAALSAPEVEEMEPKPLAIPKPEGTARELPAGRGWLRIVDGGKAAAATPGPQTPPHAPSAAPVVQPVAAPVAAAQQPAQAPKAEPTTSAEPSSQLDLLSGTPRPPRPVQLSLFDVDQ